MSSQIDHSMIEEIADGAEDVLAGLLADDGVRADSQLRGWSPALWEAMSDTGFFRVLVAEERGGLGLGLGAAGVLSSIVGRRLVAGPVIEHVAVVPLVAEALVDPSDRVLQLLDPDTGIIAFVDGAASAQKRPDRPRLDGVQLTGRADLVRFGAEADRFLVAVEDGVAEGGVAEGGAEPTLVLVPAGAAGVVVEADPCIDPLARHARVRFEHVVDHVLLPAVRPGLVAHLRAVIRALLALELTGAARHMLDEAVAYAKDRHQFGRAIGSFQEVQHLLADMETDVLACEALCGDVVAAAVTDPPSLAMGSLVAKAAASDLARTVGEGALQVHGGIAFTAEHELHRWFLHALTLQGRYGDGSDLATEVGRLLLDSEEDPWG